MGGIADYSGALVLQWPIREATRVALRPWREPRISIVSIGPLGGERRCDVPLDLVADGEPLLRGRARVVRRGSRRGTGRRTWRASSMCSRASTTSVSHRARRSSSNPTCRKAKASARRRRSRPPRWRRCSPRGRCDIEPRTARGPLPAGREPDRRRAVRRHGPDGRHLRRSRQPHGPALPAGGVPGQHPAARRTRRVGDRLRNPPRGDRRGLRRGARRRVHGLSDPRRPRRAPGQARRS